MLKQIILKSGRVLVDFSTAIDLFLLIVFLSAGTFFIFASDLEFNIKLLCCSILFLAVFILFFISVITKFLIYLLIDIKDNLAKMANTTDEHNADITGLLNVVLSLFFSSAILGLFVSGFMFYNKTVLNQAGNFTNVEVYKTIKNKNTYNDKILIDRFGFEYNPKNKKLVILDIIPDSAAESAGLKKGDQIIKVNNLDTTILNSSKLEKQTKKKKLDITYIRNGVTHAVQLTRTPVFVLNTPPNLVPALYTNSLKFKNNFVLGYFKIPNSDGTYTKRGVICNCDNKNTMLITFWDGIYKENKLVREYNYLKDNNLTQDVIIPNTYGDVIWESACYFHKQNAKKKDSD